jgi:hypothetical protein
MGYRHWLVPRLPYQGDPSPTSNCCIMAKHALHAAATLFKSTSTEVAYSSQTTQTSCFSEIKFLKARPLQTRTATDFDGSSNPGKEVACGLVQAQLTTSLMHIQFQLPPIFPSHTAQWPRLENCCTYKSTLHHSPGHHNTTYFRILYEVGLLSLPPHKFVPLQKMGSTRFRLALNSITFMPNFVNI